MNVHALPARPTNAAPLPSDLKWQTCAAAPPGSNPFEFVMSDASVDRYGDIIEPDGWKLKAFRANPIALFGHSSREPIGNWKNVRVDNGRLVGELVLAALGTSPFIDTLRKLIEQKILRAVSVGFLPIKHEPLDPEEPWDGTHFLEQELLECSLVAVPANANALNTAKALNLPRDVLAGIFCKSAPEDPSTARASLTSKSAKPLARTGAKMLTRAQRIESAQQSILEMSDRLEVLDAMESRDEATETEYLELPGKITSTRTSLAAMEAAEKALANTAPASQRSPTTPRIQAPAIIARPKNVENAREFLVKTATALFVAKGSGRMLDDVLRDPARYGSDEIAGQVIRAVTNPAITTTAAWAGELAGVGIADFLASLPRSAIYPVLKRLGSSFTFGRDGSIKIPSRSATPKINGSFVLEGNPIPVRKAGIAAITLTPKKMAVISTFTKEMAAHSTPSIESVIRQAMNEDTAESIDQALIDTYGPADNTRPAGLLFGLSGLTAASTGTQFEKMVADINTLAAPIEAARGGGSLALLMNQAQARKMAWAVAPNGTFVFSTVENGQVRDLTIVSSPTVAAGTLIMVDANEFATATGDTPEFDVSDVATIHEEDTAPLPIVGGTAQPPLIASVAAPVRSLWQTASLGIRMILPMNWTMRRAGMVSFMTGVTW